MSALAVMIALVGAMFAVPSTRAAVGDSVGDVSANSGFCVETESPDAGADPPVAGTWMVQTALSGGNAINVYHPDDTNDTDGNTDGIQGDADDKPDMVALPCAQSQAGQPVKITPNGTVTPIIEAQSPSVSISFGDSDGVVKADSELSVDVKLANFESASISSTAPVVDWIRVSGVLDGSEANSQGITLTNGRGTADFSADTGQQSFTLIIPDGTPAGQYTVSALVLFDQSTAAEPTESIPPLGGSAKEMIRASKTFTVGDATVNAASATLSLGNEGEDIAGTTANERKPETGTTPAGGDIWLKIEVSNSAGNKANGNGINTITVIAPGAVLAFHAPTATALPLKLLWKRTQVVLALSPVALTASASAMTPTQPLLTQSAKRCSSR